MTRILFVCLGNICRSPLAEGILRRQAEEAGVELEIDSAGMGDWHIGQLPDPRAIETGQARGCPMNMRARQFQSSDFAHFDIIVAMDRSNVRALLSVPGATERKVRLARSFDLHANGIDVPDPYYGEIEEFDNVAEMLEAACAGILAEVKRD